jgi:hypothetical protein
MINLKLLLDIVGFIMIYTGWLDAYKYHVSANTIRKVKTAHGHSRRFINYALINDIMRIIYLGVSALVFERIDWFLIICCIFAIIFMIEHWLTVYIYYPYRRRGLQGFKRPHLGIYFINSILPNRIRRRL